MNRRRNRTGGSDTVEAHAALLSLGMNPAALRGAVALSRFLRYGSPVLLLALAAALLSETLPWEHGTYVASWLLAVLVPPMLYCAVLTTRGTIATLLGSGSGAGLGTSFRYWGAVMRAAFRRE